ncbi:MAG TPA: type II toxin-antitoxin system VapC family toxin [Solirubrobacteraceae bacterium]
MKLLDTAVAIDHLRGVEPAVDLLARLTDEDETLAASELVRFELLAGVRPDELTALEQLFTAIVWLPIEEDIARTAGSLARKYRKAYSGIDDVDYLIAATAIVFDAEFLTTNIRHFPMFEGLGPPY